MTPSADDQLRTLAARLATREQVIEALSERLSQRSPDPDGHRPTWEELRASRTYRVAVALRRLAAPLRLAKRLASFVRATARRVLPRRKPSPLDRPTGGLRVRLDRLLPQTAAVGGGNILVFSGWCYHPAERIKELRLTRDGEPLNTAVRRHTRPDVFASRDPGLDPAGHCLDGGFFAVVDLPACTRETTATFGVEACLADGSTHRAELGRVLLRPAVDTGAEPPPVRPAHPGDPPLVAICMATYNPPEHLFKRQVESILAQTHSNWICIITDDGSPPEAFARIAELADRDSRFHIYRNPIRLGFYHNFERALALVPAEAEYIALSDHDDDWRPEKLAGLLAAFDADTSLVFSDMQIVTGAGEVVSQSYWTTRRNNYTDIASLLLANTVTGAASMFHRRLLRHVLPFPIRHGDVYHDHWIACAALAFGKIGYVDQPLYDYVQHGRNVIGHCAPQSQARWKRACEIISKVWSPAAWDRWVTNFGRINYQRFAMVREFARLLLARDDGDLVPAHRRPLQRLAAAEHSWRSWAWLAARGLWLRQVTLGYEYALIVSVWWRRLSGLLARRRPIPPATLPPPITVPDRRPIPLRLLPSPAEPRRLNVLMPSLNLQSISAADIAVLHLARKLAQSGRRVRLIFTEWGLFQPRFWRYQLSFYPGLDTFLDQVEVAYAEDRAVPTTVHPGDQFMATNWCTAHIADRAASDLGRPGFVYLIQDYAPLGYPAGPMAALAAESYSLPHYAVFSTELLRDYCRLNRVGVYADGPAAGDRKSVAFANALAPVDSVGAAELASRTPRKLLFHSRPESDHARYLFELGVTAIAEAVRAGVFVGEWEFCGIGSITMTGRVALANGKSLLLMARQSLADYAKTLKGHDIGLSLMHSPHPSLVPLEMASAGMVTLTNTYMNKTAERLREISPNLIAVDATVPTLVAGLRQAVARVDDCEARARGAQLTWSRDWDDSFPAPLLRTIGQFLDDDDLPAEVHKAA